MGGREGGVTGSLTSRALPAIIGVQEVVEAAGYNWTAARNLCGWQSKLHSPFHRLSQLLPWYKALHHRRTDTPTSISFQNVCLLFVGGTCGEGFNEPQLALGAWGMCWEDS